MSGGPQGEESAGRAHASRKPVRRTLYGGVAKRIMKRLRRKTTSGRVERPEPGRENVEREGIPMTLCQCGDEIRAERAETMHYYFGRGSPGVVENTIPD